MQALHKHKVDTLLCVSLQHSGTQQVVRNWLADTPVLTALTDCFQQAVNTEKSYDSICNVMSNAVLIPITHLFKPTQFF